MCVCVCVCVLGQMLTAEVEKDFLRTLSLIHSKDPSIYDKQTTFFKKNSMYNIATM